MCPAQISRQHSDEGFVPQHIEIAQNLPPALVVTLSHNLDLPFGRYQPCLVAFNGSSWRHKAS